MHGEKIVGDLKFSNEAQVQHQFLPEKALKTCSKVKNQAAKGFGAAYQKLGQNGFYQMCVLPT